MKVPMAEYIIQESTWLMAQLKEYVSAVPEGMMTLFYLVGKCALGWCISYFDYFSLWYNVVMV